MNRSPSLPGPRRLPRGGVDRNLASIASRTGLSSRLPLGGVDRNALIRVSLPPRIVASHAEAWIETRANLAIAHARGVASHAEAWIETAVP